MRLVVKNILFSIFVPGCVALFIPWMLTEKKLFPLMLAATDLSLLGWPILVFGGLLYGHCVWNFAWKGDGTPAPIDPPKRLIIHGAYLYIRNPMYLSVLMVLSGVTILSWQASLCLYSVTIFVIFQAWVIFYEEPALRKTFGKAYEAYCRKVGRWGFLGW